jgi:hypothetical protein
MAQKTFLECNYADKGITTTPQLTTSSQDSEKKLGLAPAPAPGQA